MAADEDTARTFDGPGLPQAEPEPSSLPEVAPTRAPTADSAESAYDLLAASVANRVARKPSVLDVPDLPGCQVVYDVNFEWEQLQAWRNANRDTETGVPDPFRVALTVLANQCREIRFNGQPVRRDGRVRTFVDTDIQEMLGATGTVQAVRRLYSNDAHVVLAGDRVIADAGYGDRVTREAEDPSPRSSRP